MSSDNSRRVARSPRDRVIRYVGLLIGIFVGWQIGARVGGGSFDSWGPTALFFAAVIGGLAFIASPYVVLGTIRWLRRKFSQIPAIDIVAAGIGLVIGGVVSSLLALPASLLPNPYGQWVPLLVALVACFLSVFVVVLRKQDLT